MEHTRASLRLWHVAVPWAVGLFVLFVAIVMQVEALGYHFADPAAFIIGYTAVAGALLVLWLVSLCVQGVDRAETTREQRTLLRIHQKTSQYRVNVYSAIVTTLLVLAVSLTVLWHWYHEFLVLASATVSPTAPLTSQKFASHRWFRYVLLVVALHYLALTRIAYALVQRHILTFYDRDTLGLLKQKKTDSSEYEVRPLRGNELARYHVDDDDSIYPVGLQDESGQLEVLRSYLRSTEEQ